MSWVVEVNEGAVEATRKGADGQGDLFAEIGGVA